MTVALRQVVGQFKSQEPKLLTVVVVGQAGSLQGRVMVVMSSQSGAMQSGITGQPTRTEDVAVKHGVVVGLRFEVGQSEIVSVKVSQPPLHFVGQGVVTVFVYVVGQAAFAQGIVFLVSITQAGWKQPPEIGGQDFGALVTVAV